MRRLALLGFIAVFALTATPVSAETVSEPDVIQGSLTENYRGTKVTVSYAACGSTFERVDADGNLVTAYDPYARYIATVKKGGRWTTTIWAHDITDLAGALSGHYGYSLTQEQIDMLVELQARYTCTA
jgi:hypothetical protein